MASASKTSAALAQAANIVRDAQALIITAGAGMGVDSGLPDFRGPEGFWRAYPPIGKLGLRLEVMSTPIWFTKNPKFAWGFFGHRYNLYSRTTPHQGFQILRKWAEKMEKGYFIFTSNVDGHFQKAGFSEERVIECHGSIKFLQSVDTRHCWEIWPVPEDFKIEVEEETLLAQSELPQAPSGHGLARPNILMFGDDTFVEDRTDEQENRYNAFMNGLDRQSNIAIIEIGAGNYVPTVRYTSEGIAGQFEKATLIRINPSEADVPKGNISIPLKGLEALEQIDSLLNKA